LFNGVGHVQNAEVVSYRHNQRSKGFAFVQMQTIEEAKRAVEELHDKEFLGRRLVVSGAKSDQHQARCRAQSRSDSCQVVTSKFRWLPSLSLLERGAQCAYFLISR